MKPKKRPYLKILGVGSGTTAILYGEPSSSFSIMYGEECILQVDLGIGITKEINKTHKGFPSVIYISHNHLDHSGELPVAALLYPTLNIWSSKLVQERLKKHRLNEIDNGSINIETIVNWNEIEENVNTNLNEDFSLEIRQSQHSEICYGFLLYFKKELVFGYSADSGYNTSYFEWLSQAPTLILDAREKSSKEHSSFNEIIRFSNTFPEKEIYITHYGRLKDKTNSLNCISPGQQIIL